MRIAVDAAFLDADAPAFRAQFEGAAPAAGSAGESGVRLWDCIRDCIVHILKC